MLTQAPPPAAAQPLPSSLGPYLRPLHTSPNDILFFPVPHTRPTTTIPGTPATAYPLTLLFACSLTSHPALTSLFLFSVARTGPAASRSSALALQSWRTRRGLPLDITCLPGVELLGRRERELCAMARLLPVQYLALKDMMMRDCQKHGAVTRQEVRGVGGDWGGAGWGGGCVVCSSLGDACPVRSAQ